MRYVNLEQLHERANRAGPVRVAVAAAADRDVLEAIKMAHDAGFAEPVLVGEKLKIARLLEICNLDQESIEIVDEADPTTASHKAVDLVIEGKAQLLMKGLVNTADFLRAVLRSKQGLRTGKLLCHLGAFEVPGYPHLFFLTDAAFNIAPSLEEKKQILHSSLDYLHGIGMPEVNVVVLAANEVPHPKMQAGLDAQVLVELANNGEFPGAIVEGPLALDGAVSAQALQHKGIQSRINGETDLFLVPTIEVGNALGKSMVYFAGAETAGIVLGAKVPIVLTSRADSPRSKLLSLAMARCMD